MSMNINTVKYSVDKRYKVNNSSGMVTSYRVSKHGVKKCMLFLHMFN